MNELALFAGAGGGILGGKLLGWRTVCGVERDAYAAQVLAQRQNDGILEAFPIWSDVCSFDGRPWKGIIDVVSGGFPCQDISVAGKQEGINGKRSGLWSQMGRIISEVEPELVWIENSPNLKNKGLETILEDLRKMGYDVRWGVVSAENAGANHQRKRIWILAKSHSSRCKRERQAQSEKWFNQIESTWRSEDVANANCKRRERAWAFAEKKRINEFTNCCENATHSNSPGCEEQWLFKSDEPEYKTTECGSWWEIEPGLDRVVDGMAHRVDRLKAIGNGQVPAVVRLAWEVLSK